MGPKWVGFFAFILGIGISGTLGQDDDTVVNILFINQDEELKPLFDAAVAYFEKNPHLKIKVGTVHRFDANYTDGVKITTAFCSEVDKIMPNDDRPDIAIDFTRIGVPSEGVKIVLKAIQLPTIAGTFGQEGDVREWRDLNDKQLKYFIQISPPADVLIQSVRSIVGVQDMTSAVVMFDEKQYEMYHKYKSLLQNMPTRHLLTKTLNETSKLSAQIENLVHVDIVNFFIAGSSKQITEVLTLASNPKAKDAPYFSDEFAWYSMTLVPGDPMLPECTRCEMDVTLVHLTPEPFDQGNKRKNFLTKTIGKSDLSLTDMFYFDLAMDAIMAVGAMKKAGKFSHDIRNNTCKNYDAVTNKKEYTYPTLELDLMAALKEASKDNGLPFHLDPSGKNGKHYPEFKAIIKRLKYPAKSSKPKENERYGVWEAGFVEGTLVKWDKEKDGKTDKNLKIHLAHTVFRIVTVIQPPFVFKHPNCNNTGKENKYLNCYYGYCIDLLDKIRDQLSFNFTIRDVVGYGYMNQTFPHEWDGMVRELKDRRADIALGAMSVMAERESVVDFTVPYYDLVGISVLMKKPYVPTSLFKFLTVLENDVWMCILGAYFFTSFLMWVFDRWSPYSYQNNREKYEDDEEKREFNLKECLWFCMTSLTPQGGGEAPKNLSGRLVAATWWLFGFIIIASYTANLAAFLTVSRLDAPIESLEDLSKQYKIQYAPMVGSSAWIYFDRMAHIEHRFYEIWKDMSLNDSMSDFERSQLAVWDYPVSDKYTKMWQAMMENTPPKNFTEAVERVRGKEKNNSKEIDGFAFLDEATNIKWFSTISCDFDQKGEEFSRKPYAIAVQKGSPLKESISHMILKLLNQRYLEQLKENWWNNGTFKLTCPKEDNQSDGISIHNIGGVFIVIFVGIVMACLTLIFEYWWYRKRNVSEELAEMALPPPKEFGSTFTTTPPTIEKTNFNTQYDKPPERTTLPSIENSW